MINLYQHQNKFVHAIRLALRTNQAVLAQAATGFGKTVVAAFMAQSATLKDKQVIFTVHRKELITQTAKTFDKFGIQYGIIASGVRPDPYANVQIASIDTLKRRLDRNYPCDILIPDESHLAMSVGWSKVINHFKDRGVLIVGLSGSPCRLDGKGLGDLFDHMVPGPSVAWLIEKKFLSDYKIFTAESVPDLSGVHTRMGDFKKDELETAMDNNVIFGDAVKQYKKHAYGKRTLCFCVSVNHSKRVAAQFNANGIPAAHIDGTTPHSERKKIIIAFADGDIKVLCNVELVTTGFDLSAQVDRDVPVEAVILLRPTQSLALYLQMVGRALRYKDYPAIILDQAMNWTRHGLPDDEREWSLEGTANTKKKPTEPSILYKQCPKCYAVHRPSPVCGNCGHVYEVVGRQLDEREGELVEMDKDEIRRRRSREQGSANTIEGLVELGRKRGLSNPHKWAANVYQARKDKEKLQLELVNLYKVLCVTFKLSEIRQLKPKELKTEIKRLQEKVA